MVLLFHPLEVSFLNLHLSTYRENQLHALKCLASMASLTDWRESERYLTLITRRLIELMKSPRSMVVRVVCQAAGDLFKSSHSSCKRPEFDELVNLLLCKTADANRFIQRDSNIALDKMVTSINLFHSVRVLTIYGPNHKNAVVRTACARLFVCVCALAGLENVLGTQANCRTRKRILAALSNFLLDKCVEVRRFGERLYQILKSHTFFNDYFYKDMDIGMKLQFKKIFIGLDS